MGDLVRFGEHAQCHVVCHVSMLAKVFGVTETQSFNAGLVEMRHRDVGVAKTTKDGKVLKLED